METTSAVIHNNVWQNLILAAIRDDATVARMARVDKNLHKVVEAYFTRTKSLIVPWKRVDATQLAQWPLLPVMHHIRLDNFWLTDKGFLFLGCTQLRSLELHCDFSGFTQLYVPEILALAAKVFATTSLDLWYGNERLGMMDRVWTKDANKKPSPVYSSSSDDEEACDRKMEQWEKDWAHREACDVYFNDADNLLELYEETTQWEWNVAHAEAHLEEEERGAKRHCTQ